MKLFFAGFLLLCGLVCKAQNSNGTLLVYDYEKLDFVAYGFEVFIRSTNGTEKDVAIEVASGASYLNKREVEEMIKALEAILTVNPTKTGKGKRTGVYVLPNGTRVSISENNEGYISFQDSKFLPTPISSAGLKKLLEVLKVAVVKL